MAKLDKLLGKPAEQLQVELKTTGRQRSRSTCRRCARRSFSSSILPTGRYLGGEDVRLDQAVLQQVLANSS